jgi:hypothetical protein
MTIEVTVLPPKQAKRPEHGGAEPMAATAKTITLPASAVEARSILPIPGTLSKVAYILPETMTFDDWQRAGEVLQLADRSLRFWIGDWLCFGEARYGEKYAQAVEATGRKVEDLMNMVFVAKAVPISLRNENLTSTHHAIVAPLKPDAQREWLATAQRDQLSTRGLRATIKEQRENPMPPEVPSCKKCGTVCSVCDTNAFLRTKGIK